MRESHVIVLFQSSDGGEAWFGIAPETPEVLIGVKIVMCTPSSVPGVARQHLSFTVER